MAQTTEYRIETLETLGENMELNFDELQGR